MQGLQQGCGHTRLCVGIGVAACQEWPYGSCATAVRRPPLRVRRRSPPLDWALSLPSRLKDYAGLRTMRDYTNLGLCTDTERKGARGPLALLLGHILLRAMKDRGGGA